MGEEVTMVIEMKPDVMTIRTTSETRNLYASVPFLHNQVQDILEIFHTDTAMSQARSNRYSRRAFKGLSVALRQAALSYVLMGRRAKKVANPSSITSHRRLTCAEKH